jgi:hypothetical protein
LVLNSVRASASLCASQEGRRDKKEKGEEIRGRPAREREM